MCGFYFQYTLDDNELRIPSEQNFSRFLKPRGPDEDNIFSNDNFYVRHFLLRIREQGIGSQPVSDSGKIFVFNGEIYNEEARDIGDTTYLFENFSEVVSGKVVADGIFAAVMMDENRRQVQAIRDFWGCKPLFVFNDGKRLILSSSLRVISCSMRLELDMAAIADYLKLGFFPGDTTPYLGVRKVKPGSCETYDLSGSTITMQESGLRWSGSVDDVERAIEHAVSSQMIANVDVGLLVSGGVDSAVLSYWASKCSRKIASYSIFDSSYENLDEEKNFEVIKDKLGIESNVFNVERDEHSIEEVVKQLDIPVADTSIFLNSQIYEKINKKNVKAVITGVGADELFGGYRRYWFSHFLLGKTGLIYTVLQSIISVIVPNRILMRSRVLRAFQSKRRVDYSAFITGNNSQDLVSEKKYWVNNLRDVQDFERREYLINCLLSFTDGISMANSVEARVPFLSNFLTNNSILNQLPWHPSKKYLKKLRVKYFGNNFSNKKRGFAIPYGDFLTGYQPSKFVLPYEECFRKGVDELSSERALFSFFILNQWLISSRDDAI